MCASTKVSNIELLLVEAEKVLFQLVLQLLIQTSLKHRA